MGEQFPDREKLSWRERVRAAAGNYITEMTLFLEAAHCQDPVEQSDRVGAYLGHIGAGRKAEIGITQLEDHLRSQTEQ